MKRTRPARASASAVRSWEPPPRPPRLTPKRGLPDDGGIWGVKQMAVSLRQAVEAFDGRPTWHLPGYQRPQRWTDDQAVIYLNRLFVGIPAGTFFFEERALAGGINNRKIYVLDGQQRLSAMGAEVIRSDGTPNTTARVRFNPIEWTWEVGDPELLRPSPTMLCGADWGMAMHEATELPDRSHTDEGHWLMDARQVAHEVVFHAITVGTSVHDRRIPFLRQVFAALNSGGTPMTAGELAGLLAGDVE